MSVAVIFSLVDVLLRNSFERSVLQKCTISHPELYSSEKWTLLKVMNKDHHVPGNSHKI